MVGVLGRLFTVMLTGDEAAEVQPEALITCTVYVPEETLMLCEVAPLLHRYEEEAGALSVVLCPLHTVVVPLMLGVDGGVLTVMLTGAEAAEVHPEALITCTV